MTDFGAEQFGQFFVFIPFTDVAREWVDQNVDLTGQEFMGGSFAVPTGRLEATLSLMEEVGFTVTRREEP